MRKFNFAKIISFVFICAVLVGALAIVAFATEENTVEIVSQNVYFGEKYQLMYAVNAPEGATVSAKDSKGNAIDVELFAKDPTNNDGVKVADYAYILAEGVAAQAIDEVITFTVECDGVSASKSYSVLQYVYERTQGVSANQATGTELAMFNAFITFADAANVHIDKATGSFNDYVYVTVEGATVNGVNPTGMYVAGATPFANLELALDYDAAVYKVVYNVTVGDAVAEQMDLDEIKGLVVEQNVSVVAELVELSLGSAENPIYPEFDPSTMTATVTVPAGATYNFASWNLNGEMVLTANGEELAFVAGTPRATPSTFVISNDSAEDVDYVLVAAYPVGHAENPATLAIGANTANVVAGSQGYYYTWTAAKAGTLTLTVAAENTGWSYVVNNLTSYVYGDTVVNGSESAVITVAAGDEIQIIVNTYDEADVWNAPAGVVTVNAAFEQATITNIKDALSASEGDAVKLTGTVVAFYEVWSSYGNCSPYIVDEAGNQILVFRTTTNVGIGDVIEVVGTITVYSKTNQVAQGSTVTVVEKHECSDFTDATCDEAPACVVCGLVNGEALGHTEANAEGKCDRCGVDLEAAAKEVTVTMKYSGSTTGNMTGSNDAAKVGLDATIFSVIGNKGSTNNNCGLNKSGQIRLYGKDGNGSYFTVSIADGYTIKSIKITLGGTVGKLQVTDATGAVLGESSTKNDVLEYDVNGGSFKLQNVITGATTQIYILSIEITYAPN